MKVLKKKDWEREYKREIECSQCEAVLEIEGKDIWHQPGEGDQRDYSPEYFYVTCPECSQRLKLSDVPPFLRKLATDRSARARTNYFDR